MNRPGRPVLALGAFLAAACQEGPTLVVVDVLGLGDVPPADALAVTVENGRDPWTIFIEAPAGGAIDWPTAFRIDLLDPTPGTVQVCVTALVGAASAMGV